MAFLQVGMLSLQQPQPEVNFQEESPASFDKLLHEVRSRLPQQEEARKNREEKAEKSDGEQDNASFQVN